ncbi:helix-turn-helix XRE-family transcriptional regulators [Candidatus Termititenax persephonae]|uniref:Helix-turn-helix XRE-family transcriptional regulators n=1 Tax=Candidatus Termititenax persephonae TaxID=2218525 RepID=A0A388TIW6_9BACT|nr:helix-turn-helix XRE-family transcriptional regulators [Candidatus Termititenax persephonae]
MLKTKKWDSAEHFRDEAEITDYLEYVFADSDPKLIARAIGDVVRARGMLTAARHTGLTKAGLYRSLSESGDPKLSTITKVADFLGYRMAFLPKTKSGKRRQAKAA